VGKSQPFGYGSASFPCSAAAAGKRYGSATAAKQQENGIQRPVGSVTVKQGLLHPPSGLRTSPRGRGGKQPHKGKNYAQKTKRSKPELLRIFFLVYPFGVFVFYSTVAEGILWLAYFVGLAGISQKPTGSLRRNKYIKRYRVETAY
jgi:hypothetical protein